MKTSRWDSLKNQRQLRKPGKSYWISLAAVRSFAAIPAMEENCGSLLHLGTIRSTTKSLATVVHGDKFVEFRGKKSAGKRGLPSRSCVGQYREAGRALHAQPCSAAAKGSDAYALAGFQALSDDTSDTTGFRAVPVEPAHLYLPVSGRCPICTRCREPRSLVPLSCLVGSFENQLQRTLAGAEQRAFENFNFKYWKMF